MVLISPTEIEIAELVNLTGPIDKLTTTARRLAFQRDRMKNVLTSPMNHFRYPNGLPATFADELDILANNLANDDIPEKDELISILKMKAKQIRGVLK